MHDGNLRNKLAVQLLIDTMLRDWFGIFCLRQELISTSTSTFVSKGALSISLYNMENNNLLSRRICPLSDC
ncbi:hypothetical protein ACFX15_001908 [Malus domestica]